MSYFPEISAGYRGSAHEWQAPAAPQRGARQPQPKDYIPVKNNCWGVGKAPKHL
jgi:hypothetical protein